MESATRQLEEVRDEIVRLLCDYPYASDRDRETIYERCEILGGEIQELVGVVKLAICNTARAAVAEADEDPDYAAEIAFLSRQSLAAIHAAGGEVAAAITLLRESRTE